MGLAWPAETAWPVRELDSVVLLRDSQLDFNRKEGQKIPLHFKNFCIGPSATFVFKKRASRILSPDPYPKDCGQFLEYEYELVTQRIRQHTHAKRLGLGM